MTFNTGPGYGSELTENAESGSAMKPSMRIHRIGSGSGPALNLNAGSRFALKPMRIHSTGWKYEQEKTMPLQA